MKHPMEYNGCPGDGIETFEDKVSEALFRKLSRKELLILYLATTHGMKYKEIGELFRINRMQVYFIIKDIKRKLSYLTKEKENG